MAATSRDQNGLYFVERGFEAVLTWLQPGKIERLADIPTIL
jgi:hypothetical protein